MAFGGEIPPQQQKANLVVVVRDAALLPASDPRPKLPDLGKVPVLFRKQRPECGARPCITQSLRADSFQ